MHQNPPTIRSREVVYANPYQTITRVIADFPDFSKEYFVNDTGTRAGIVVVHDGSVLLVRQYRLLIDDLSWEIPGGRVDEGEEPAEAAIRECLEETGVKCLHVHPLINYIPGLDVSKNPTHLFYCDRIGTSDPGQIHVDEVAGSEWVDMAECINMVARGQIQDSFTLIAIMSIDALHRKSGI